MKKRKRFVIITFIILVIGSVYIYNKSRPQLTTTEKKIYNLYKSEESLEVSNIENLKDTPNFSLMSFNIHKGMDSDNRYSLDEIKRFIEKSDVDIICLQEVPYSHDIIIKSNNEYESEYVSNVTTDIMPIGLSTFSKYPLVESNHILLPSYGEQRGALHTVYKIGDDLVNVINTHLGLSTKERIKQINAILDYTKDLEGEVILAGDFNQAPLDIENFRDTGKYHGYDKRSTYMGIDVRIDYIFMTTDDIYSTNYRHIDTDMSDHYPIVTEIKYKPKAIKSEERVDIWKLNSMQRKMAKARD